MKIDISKPFRDMVMEAGEEAKRWEVQTLIGNDWDNIWTEQEGDTPSTPLTFTTKEEAQKELDDHIQTVKDAVAAGEMDAEAEVQDFRVVPVGK